MSNQVGTFDGANFSVILGDATNVTSPSLYAAIGGGANNTVSANYAAIGGGANNTVSANYADIPGGRGLTANNYGETVVGYYNNSALGTVLAPPSFIPSTPNPVSSTADYALFAVGNGTGVNHSDAFEVSYNGHATPTQIYGDYVPLAPKPVQGASYNDNSILAWGQVSAAGVAVHDFGVVSATWAGNVCTIVMNYPGTPANILEASITATGEDDDCPGTNPPGIVVCTASQIGGGSCKAGGNAFYVKTYLIPLTTGLGCQTLNTAPGVCVPMAEPFFFKVCGRH